MPIAAAGNGVWGLSSRHLVTGSGTASLVQMKVIRTRPLSSVFPTSVTMFSIPLVKCRHFQTYLSKLSKFYKSSRSNLSRGAIGHFDRLHLTKSSYCHQAISCSEHNKLNTLATTALLTNSANNCHYGSLCLYRVPLTTCCIPRS